ncbi:MAG TPA: hypothetical protein DIC42_05590 [Holosporales bacterium]|nr:hypothetical protein [Holosporales bacterium]
MVDNIIIICSGKLVDGNSAGAARVLNYSKAISSMGRNVYISSLTNKKILAKNTHVVQENIFKVTDPISYKSILSKVFLKNNYLITTIYLFRIAKYAKKLAGNSCFILYPSIDPTMEPLCVLILKKLYKYKIFCEINELRRAGVDRNLLNETPIGRLLGNIHNQMKICQYRFNENVIKYFDGLLIISTNLIEYFKRINTNFIHIPILTDTRSYTPIFNKKYILGDVFTMAFAGQIGISKEGFNIFYMALGKLKKSNVAFELHLFGSYMKNEKKELERIALENNISSNIIFHGLIDQADVINHLSNKHLLLLPRIENLKTKYGFSTKLSEYLISGTPVLVTDVSDNSLYIQDKVNGFIIKNTNEHAYFEKLIDIITHYNKYVEEIPINAFNTAKDHFDFTNHAQSLVNFIDDTSKS